MDASSAEPVVPSAPLAPLLALHPLERDRFRSVEPAPGPRVFGGLLVAQALAAAAATVDDGFPARSLQATYLRAGEPGEPLDHEVERTRAGGRFATRRVVLRQGDHTLLVLTADFHRPEDGVGYEPSSPGIAGVPGPEVLPPGRYHTAWVDNRDVPVGEGPPTPAHARRHWCRVREPLPTDAALHQQAVAFLSDHGPTRAAREPHAHLADDSRRQSVSLDHQVWFHRPIDANRWLLAEHAPVVTGRGRGLTLGSLRDADGTLLATVAQEVLLRER